MRPTILLTVGALAAGCATAPDLKPPLPVFSTPAPAASPTPTPTPSGTPTSKVTATKTPKPKATAAPKPKPAKPKATPSSLPTSAVRTFADLPRVWQRIAMCESSGNLHAVARSGRYYGMWQLARGWYAGAGLVPERTTLAQQYALALHVKAVQGFQAWTCARIVGII